MPCHPDRVRRNYPELLGYHAGDVQVPHFTDDETPENPPRADDVWDELPILERGWNVIEGENP